jgi:hypothetical protein
MLKGPASPPLKLGAFLKVLNSFMALAYWPSVSKFNNQFQFMTGGRT